MMRMVVADRNETMRLGVRTLFAAQGNAAQISEAATKADLMAAIRDGDYDLVVVDPVLCGGTGESLIRQIRSVAPRSNVLVYTDMDELKFGIRAIRCGAKGYVMKTSSCSELVSAAGRVSIGRVHMSEALAEAFALNLWRNEEAHPHEKLSEREMLVFSLLVCGWNVTNIASRLHLSIKTISTHKSRTMAKLACRNIGELVEYALSRDLKPECESRCAGW